MDEHHIPTRKRRRTKLLLAGAATVIAGVVAVCALVARGTDPYTLTHIIEPTPSRGGTRIAFVAVHERDLSPFYEKTANFLGLYPQTISPRLWILDRTDSKISHHENRGNQRRGGKHFVKAGVRNGRELGVLPAPTNPPIRRKGQLQFRYYVCTKYQKETAAACPGSRISLAELEGKVVDEIRMIGKDRSRHPIAPSSSPSSEDGNRMTLPFPVP